MPTYSITAPDGRTIDLEGDSPPTEQELEAVFAAIPGTVTESLQAGSPSAGETKNLPGDLPASGDEAERGLGVPASVTSGAQSGVPVADDSGTFNLGAVADQAGNVARQVVGGVADTGAGIVDALTVIPRAAGAPIPSYQEELKKERAQEGNTYNESKEATDTQTYEPLKGIIGPTFNPANFLGQLIGSAGLALQASASAATAGLGKIGSAIVGGAVEGGVGGLAAPTTATNAQDELGQRATSGVAGTLLGGIVGGAGGAAASRFKKHANLALETAAADLQAANGAYDHTGETLAAAKQHTIDNPHEETHAAYQLAREQYIQAESVAEKAQKHYNDTRAKHGKHLSTPEEIDGGLSAETLDNRTAPPDNETNPFANPPSTFANAPQGLDLEVKRAIIQNHLGENPARIARTLKSLSKDPDHAQYIVENYDRLEREAQAQVQHEIELRYAEAEAKAPQEVTSGETQGSRQESNPSGNSGGPEVRSQDRETSTETSDAQADTDTTTPEGRVAAIAQLNSFPGPIVNYLLKAANPVGKVQLNAAQRQAMQNFPGKVVNAPGAQPFFQGLQQKAQAFYKEIKPALTNRFGAIQDLGEDSVTAVDKFFGMNAEASSYLLKLGGEIKDELGVDPDLLKGFNEFLLLKRLEGRGRNNPADPLLLKRFGQSSQAGVGGNQQVADHLNLMKGSNPQAFAAYEKLNYKVRDLITRFHNMHVLSGTISQDTINAFTNADPNYIPFASMSKALEEAQAMVYKGQKLGVNSTSDLIKSVSDYNGPMHTDDRAPLDNLIGFIEQSTRMIRRNEVVRSVVDNPASGAIPFTGRSRTGYTPVSAMFNGEAEQFLVPDDLARAVAHMSPEQAKGFSKFVSNLTKIQTGIATGYNPVFTVVQALKDIPTAILQNADIAPGIVKNLPGAAKDTLKEAFTGRQTPAMQEFYQSGAGGSFIGEFRTEETQELRSFADEFRPKNLAEAVKANGINGLRSYTDTVGRANTAIDNIPRVAAFRAKQAQQLAKGATREQALAASAHTGRNATVDFAEGGYLTKQLNAVVPFANVAFQGPKIALSRLTEQMKDNPAGLAATVGALVVVPELVMWGNNHSTPEKKKVWDDIPQFDKDANIIFVQNDNKDPQTGRYTGILKIPINDSYKAIRNSVREGAEFAFFHDRQNLGQAIRSAANTLPGAQSFAPIEASAESNEFFGTGLTFSAGPILNNFPIFIKQISAIASNYDPFRQDQILKGKEDQEIAARGTAEEKQGAYKPQTTPSGKALARVANLTPVQADYFLKNSIFAGGGETFGAITDSILEGINPSLAPTARKDTGFVQQFSRRFSGSYGGAQDKRDLRRNSSAVTDQSLSAVQEKNLAREIEAALKDPNPESGKTKLEAAQKKFEALSILEEPKDDFGDRVEKAAQRIAFPADQFIFDLKKMSDSDRYEAIIQKLEELASDPAAATTLLDTLEINKISIDEPENYLPKEVREQVKKEQKLSLALPQSRKITDLGGGLFKVRESDGRERTVRKENNQFTVIG